MADTSWFYVQTSYTHYRQFISQYKKRKLGGNTRTHGKALACSFHEWINEGRCRQSNRQSEVWTPSGERWKLIKNIILLEEIIPRLQNQISKRNVYRINTWSALLQLFCPSCESNNFLLIAKANNSHLLIHAKVIQKFCAYRERIFALWKKCNRKIPSLITERIQGVYLHNYTNSKTLWSGFICFTRNTVSGLYFTCEVPLTRICT